MTTQKAQSKIKTSTIAITILSVLLAVAVAATVVLAAFAVNKQAQTTITFGGGVTLQVSSDTMNNQAKWIIKSVNNEGTVGSDITTSATALTNGAQFAPFKVKNTSTSAVAIAFQLTITDASGILYVGETPNETTALSATNYNASGEAGSDTLATWFVIDSVAASTEATLTKAINSIYSAAEINKLNGGETATLSIKIAAVHAGTDATAALASAITEGTWETIVAGDVVPAA